MGFSVIEKRTGNAKKGKHCITIRSRCKRRDLDVPLTWSALASDVLSMKDKQDLNDNRDVHAYHWWQNPG